MWGRLHDLILLHKQKRNKKIVAERKSRNCACRMLVLVLLGVAACASGRELECLSWWRWDTPDACRARGCRVADLVNCVYPRPQTATLKRIHVVQVGASMVSLPFFLSPFLFFFAFFSFRGSFAGGEIRAGLWRPSSDPRGLRRAATLTRALWRPIR